MTNILLYIIILFLILLLAKAVYIVIAVRRFDKYMKRSDLFQNNLADIQVMFKQMTLDHHNSIEESLNDAAANIIKHISYVNRWQKVIAKMVRSGIDDEPKMTETPREAVKAAEEMHGLGLEIAKEAFEEKEGAQAAVDDAEAWKDETERQTEEDRK